jgi:hypothetical protein
MNQLLIYFKKDCLELWSLDNNGRVLPVMFNSSNQLPLYFLLCGDEIVMNNYAKEQYLNGAALSFGDFWKNINNDSISYKRLSTLNSFATLLPYVLKESILPSIAQSHFNTTLSSFINAPKTLVSFDSFVEDNHKEIILKLFIEVIGFDSNSIITLDFFYCYRDIMPAPFI